ncbi:MAG: hypothetical protein HQL95_05660 [Magnetococcales bacterium]|nr:hypothetical protein [Magnetococcales bacterium]
MTIGSSSDDYHLRFQVASPDFSAEQDRLHTEAMERMRAAVAEGRRWPEVCSLVKMPDEAFKRLIQDDFLKVLIAERHFQGGERLKGMAKELGVPMELLMALKVSMLKEVSDAARQAYRLSNPQDSQA